MRTGGEERDRRLAALRLVGADHGMTRRIAAGEALVAAGRGLLLGAVLFLVIRANAERWTLWDLSVFSSDVRRSLPLALLVRVEQLRRTRTDAQFDALRRAMLVGASIVIALIGCSLLLTALEPSEPVREVDPENDERRLPSRRGK